MERLRAPLHGRSCGPRDEGRGGSKDDWLSRRFEACRRGVCVLRGHLSSPEEFIRERQRVYVEAPGIQRAVLDVGCGRGEMLDLLRDHRVPATGIDLDPAMVERCVRKGPRCPASGRARLSRRGARCVRRARSAVRRAPQLSAPDGLPAAGARASRVRWSVGGRDCQPSFDPGAPNLLG